MSRKYHQFCGVAKALDLVGERWTLLLVRDLLLGPRRYGDLLASCAGLTTNLLASRLAAMVERGLVEKVRLPPPAGTTVYQLTALGRELEPVVLALGRFGSRWLTAPEPDDVVNPRWAMVSLKRRFVPRPGLSGAIRLEIDEQAFEVRFDPSGIDVRDAIGPAGTVDATLAGPRAGWFPLFTRRAPLRAILDAGQLRQTGTGAVVEGFAEAAGLGADPNAERSDAPVD